MILLVALAGGLGAVARWLVDVVLADRGHGGLGLWVVNVAGSLLLGWLSAQHDAATWALLGTGFAGGFTTFSTAAVAVASALLGRGWWCALTRAAGMLALCAAAAWVGASL